MKTNSFELAALLNRAAAAIETPADLTADERRHVCEDLCAQADLIDPPASGEAAQHTASMIVGHIVGSLESYGYNVGDVGQKTCDEIAAETPQLLEAVRACNSHASNIARMSEAVEMLQGNPSPEAIDTVRALLNAALQSVAKE